MCQRAHVKNVAITVNKENERLVLRFQGGTLYAKEAFEHELCAGGRVVASRASKTHGVFFCKACKLRVHFPMSLDTKPSQLKEIYILEYFRDKFETEPEIKPCRLCGKTDSTGCSVCNPLPPKK